MPRRAKASWRAASRRSCCAPKPSLTRLPGRRWMQLVVDNIACFFFHTYMSHVSYRRLS